MNKRLCNESCKIGPFHSESESPLLSPLLPSFEPEGRGGDAQCCPVTLASSLPELPEGWVVLTGAGRGMGENAEEVDSLWFCLFVLNL